LYKPWSQGSGGATIGKTIFLCVYIEKKIFFSRTSRPISIKLGTVNEFKIVRIKGQVLFKGEIITKMGWGHHGHLKIFSQTTEPQELIFT
jgi:hypothetical protein